MFFVKQKGFTLVELMIVIAIIGILAGALFPGWSYYVARGRDVVRISDIKKLSASFQLYSNLTESYPDNQNQFGVTSYCISDIMFWPSAVALPDRQYSQLGGTGAFYKDPTENQPHIGLCSIDGSYFYARLKRETGYGVVAGRMELQTTGANWSGALLLTDTGSIDSMIDGKPLDTTTNYPDKLFILITN